MGTYAIRMPDIGEGIAEVELVAWRVELGDAVQEDQVVAEGNRRAGVDPAEIGDRRAALDRA